MNTSNALTPTGVNNAIEIRGLDFYYGTFKGLKGINLDIPENKVTAFIGPSGCGKSTLLRIIAGLLAPSEGRVEWPGGRPAQTGFVFQDPTLMPWADALANAALPLRIRGVARAEREADAAAALAAVGLGGFERAMPAELSGGMRMRVSLARALVTEPPLLLMDEPFAALDEITRFRLNNDLLNLWRDERFTVVFVTHSVFESVFLAERIMVMAPRPGRVVQELRVPAEDRDLPEFRTSANYAAHCREVSHALAAAMEVA